MTRAHRGLVLLLALLCGALTVAVALTASWARTSADDLSSAAFREALHPATQVQVTYTAVQGDAVPPGAADEVAGAVAPALRSVLTEPRHAVTTIQMVPKVLPARPGEPAYLAVAGFPDAASLVEVVEGRMPEPGDPVTALPPEVAAEYDGPPRAPVVEVVLQEDAAVELDIPVGSWVTLSGASYYGSGQARTAVLHVVGTVRAADPYPSPVDDVDALRAPFVSDTPELNLVRATALAADEETVLDATWEQDTDLRFSFDLATSPTADQAARLVEEGRKAGLQAWPQVVESAPGTAATGLGGIAETVVDQRTTSDGLVVLVVTALGAAALVLLLAAAGVLAVRREPVTAVVRARGAGTRWFVGQRGLESLAVVLPGWLLAVALAPGSWLLATAAAATCAVLVTAAQTVRLPGGDQLRLVLRDSVQLGLVLLAGGAVALVLLGDDLAPGDPVLLLAAPLVGAGTAVAAMRLLSLALGGARALARRTRSATGLVSVSQSIAVVQRVALPATALVLAASAGVLAVAVSDSLHRGAETAGWEEVGADVTVTANGVDDATVARLAGLPGVTGVAAVFSADSVSLDTRGGVEGVTVLGVDPAALAEVGEERLRGLSLPAPVDGEIAGVLSPDLQLDDDRASLRYAQDLVDVHVVDRLDAVPGVTEGESFLLVDRDDLSDAVGRPLDLSTHVLVAGDVDPAAVREVVQERDPAARVATRAAVAEERLADEVVARTLVMTRVAVVVSAVLAGFAVLLVAGLGAPVRRRSAAVLHAIGGDARGGRRAGVLGLLPVVAGVCLAAAACGALLSLLAGTGFDLAGLTGTLARQPVRPSAGSALVVLGVLTGLVLLAVAAALTRRTSSHQEQP
jgi:hypothetical protein